nr:RNA-directed DNA polymerase, eukaryota [Tanacetum cinerariifolium]
MFDEAIDMGNIPVEMVHKRLETLNKIQQVNNTHMSEVAQKAKIKWVVEGDENTKFFHGMLNKNRNKKSIQGIMVNGTWIDDPVKVKYEFLDHFRNRFDKPPENRARIDICFPNVLSNDQRDDLERMVMKEEVKRLCGIAVVINPLRVVDGGLFTGIKLNSMVSLSHLFYVDDAILLVNGSKIMGVNVEDGKIQNGASKLGCLVLKTPFTYLGTKVGENMSRNEAWKEVVDKEARSLKGMGMVDLIRLKLGNGDSFLFWEDKWYASGAIKELFPQLYALELHKHATICMKLMAPSLDNSFRRRVRSGAEESQFNSLLEIVLVINLVPCED